MPEGLDRSRRARWVHGRFSEETRRARAAAVERTLAEMLDEAMSWAPAAGFIVEPIRRRGFHGVRLRRPYDWRELKKLLNAALEEERKARGASKA